MTSVRTKKYKRLVSMKLATVADLVVLGFFTGIGFTYGKDRESEGQAAAIGVTAACLRRSAVHEAAARWG